MNSINIDFLKQSTDKANFISKYIENKNIDIELIYDSNFKNTKTIRTFIENIFTKLNLNKIDISRFILIVDELNNNAIEYGTEEDGKNKLRIKSIKTNNEIEIIIEIEDTGKGNKPKKALEMETLRAHQLKLGYNNHESIRGRGLFMITVKTVDRLYFKDSLLGGLIVGVRKKIKT